MKAIIDFCVAHVGIPYKQKPPFSMELGYDCLEWCKIVYNLADIKVQHSLDDLKLYTKQFRKLDPSEPVKLLDIALFYVQLIGERHVGLMLDERTMSHCTIATNGVTISDISRYPWKQDFKGFYRFNENFSR